MQFALESSVEGIGEAIGISGSASSKNKGKIAALSIKQWLLHVREEWREQNGFVLYEMSGCGENGLWKGKEWFSCLDLAPSRDGFEPGTQRFIPKTKAEKRILLNENSWVCVSVTHMASAVKGRTRKYVMIDNEIECAKIAYARLSGAAVPSPTRLCLSAALASTDDHKSKLADTPIRSRNEVSTMQLSERDGTSVQHVEWNATDGSTNDISGVSSIVPVSNFVTSEMNVSLAPRVGNLLQQIGTEPMAVAQFRPQGLEALTRDSGVYSHVHALPAVQAAPRSTTSSGFGNLAPIAELGAHRALAPIASSEVLSQPSSPASHHSLGQVPQTTAAAPDPEAVRQKLPITKVSRKRGRPPAKAQQTDAVPPPAEEIEVIAIDDDTGADEANPLQAVPAGSLDSVKQDCVFRFLLLVLTTGDLGGGHTVFQLLGRSSAGPLLIKGSINFGKDGRLSFLSAETEGILLSLAEERQNKVRELLSPLGYSQDAVLFQDGTLANRGMGEEAFALLQRTVAHMRGEHLKMAEGCRAVPKRVGKFAYFCALCGRRFTFPCSSLLNHARMHS